MEESELRDIIDKAGYIITHSPRDVTHAICTRHGKIVPVNADDHNCCWIKSLAIGEKERLGVMPVTSDPPVYRKNEVF